MSNMQSLKCSLPMVLVLNNMGVATVFILTCMCAVPLRGQKPGQVDPLKAHRGNPQCWEASSALLLEMRSPRIADTVSAFWDLMESLRASNNSKHTALFWDLAQVFWDIYLDCIVSRSHGLGRRHITAVQSLITDDDGGDNCGTDNQSFVVEQEKTTQNPSDSTAQEQSPTRGSM